MKEYFRVEAEISLDAIEQNIKNVKNAGAGNKTNDCN